jgi:hypothetical protein
MGTAITDTKEWSGETLDVDGVGGAGDLDQFAVLGVDYGEEIAGDDCVYYVGEGGGADC